MYSHHHHPAPLSIDTSFTQDWSPPSPPFSTSSPSTPQLYSHSQLTSPSMCHSPLVDVEDTFGMSFNIDPFGQHQHHQQHQMTGYDHVHHHHHHHQAALDMDTSVFLSSEFEALSKQSSSSSFGSSLDQPKLQLQLAGQDLDFSAFMSSLEQSTYVI
jgi:hypothetical protein